jgi:WD40 repeat protein
MSLYQDARPRSPRRLQPLGAVAVSLAAVLGWTVLLGVGFLPGELRKLADDHWSDCILQHHPLADGRQVILRRRWRKGEWNGGCVREVVLVGQPPDSAQRVLFPASARPLATAICGEGSQLFVRDMDGQVFAIDLNSSQQKPEYLGNDFDEGSGDLSCSGSGGVLVAGGRRGLCAWNTGDRRLRWSRVDCGVASWTFDQTADRLLVNTLEGALVELDLATGQTLRVIATFNDSALCVASSHDRTRIARIGPGGRLDMLDRASGLPVWPDFGPPPRASFAPRTMAFSPCGKVLITVEATDLNCLVVWNVATGQRAGELRVHTKPVTGLEFDSNGSLRSWGLDGTVCTWKSPADDPRGSFPRIQTFEPGGTKSNWPALQPNLSAAVAALR